MTHRRIEALRRDIVTPRFVLRPLTRWQMLRLQHHYLKDEGIRALLTLRRKPPSLWQSFRRIGRANGRTRFHHAIVDRRCRAKRAHAAGVGTDVAILQAFVILTGRQHHDAAVARR